MPALLPLTMVETDTRVLVERARAGDSAALDELLDRHLPGLHAFIRLRAGHMVSAKESTLDLAQSVCREVLEDLGGFEYRGDHAFRQWLFTLALRKVVDRARFYGRAKRDAAKEVRAVAGVDHQQLLEAYGNMCTPSQDASAREELARVESAFDRLNEDDREVITLSRLVGLSHAQVAEQMGRSEEAVRKLLSRALLRLAKLVDPAQT